MKNEESMKFSKRKNSFENQKILDTNNSLLSDNQNLEWFQKRFEKIQEENDSQGEQSCSGVSNAQRSRFTRTKVTVEKESVRSISTNKKAESGKVHCVQNDKNTDKISGNCECRIIFREMFGANFQNLKMRASATLQMVLRIRTRLLRLRVTTRDSFWTIRGRKNQKMIC